MHLPSDEFYYRRLKLPSETPKPPVRLPSDSPPNGGGLPSDQPQEITGDNKSATRKEVRRG